MVLPVFVLTSSVDAQQVKPKSANEAINEAYSLILNRGATQAERQFWNERLSKFSPIAILDLYEGLTRLPEYRKRFAGLNPKAQVALMYRTLLRKNTVDAGSEATWLAYLQKNGLQGTIESIVTSVDRTMDVYKSVGLSTQQEADAVHVAEDTAQNDRPKAVALYKSIVRNTRVPSPYYYLARVQEAFDIKGCIETLRLETARFPDDCIAELRLARLLYDHGVQGVSFQRSRNAMHISDERIGADALVTNMHMKLAQAKHPEILSREMLMTRAQVHARADQYPSVFAEVERAMAYGPGDGMVYLYRGDAFYNTQKYEEAIKDLNIAEKYIGKSLELLWARSISYSELGRWQQALNDLNVLVPMAPFPRFYSTRAKCYGALGKRKEQIADLNHVIALEPRSAKPLIARGRAYLSMGKTKDALADANKAVSLGRRYRESYKFRVECYTKMKNKVAADADRKTIEQLSKVFDEKHNF
ncbi:MAG: hypothetical protein C0469_09695 [Cyanobacteria bacterium DS2.3.42]|nr:hypothetical protein [Cyanobacteria bacterium DS2.3.42]